MNCTLDGFREFLRSIRPEWDEYTKARLRQHYEQMGVLAVVSHPEPDPIAGANVIPFRPRRPAHEEDKP